MYCKKKKKKTLTQLLGQVFLEFRNHPGKLVIWKKLEIGGKSRGNIEIVRGRKGKKWSKQRENLRIFLEFRGNRRKTFRNRRKCEG